MVCVSQNVAKTFCPNKSCLLAVNGNIKCLELFTCLTLGGFSKILPTVNNVFVVERQASSVESINKKLDVFSGEQFWLYYVHTFKIASGSYKILC